MAEGDEPTALGGRTPAPGPARGGAQSAAAASRIRVDISDVSKLKTALSDTQTQAKSLSDTLAAFDTRVLPTIKRVNAELQSMRQALGTSGTRGASRPTTGSGGGVQVANQHAGAISGAPTITGAGQGSYLPQPAGAAYDQALLGGAPQQPEEEPPQQQSYLTRSKSRTPPAWATSPMFRGAVATVGGFASLAGLTGGHLQNAVTRSYLLNTSQLLTGRDIGTTQQIALGMGITKAMGNTGLSYDDVTKAFGTLTSTGVMGGSYGASRMASVGFLSAINPTQGNTASAQQVGAAFTSQNYYRMRMAGINASIATGQNLPRLFDQIINRIEGASGHPLSHTEIMSGLQQGTHLNADLTAMGLTPELIRSIVQYWAARKRTGLTGMAAINASGARNNLAYSTQQTGAASAQAGAAVDKGFIPSAEGSQRARAAVYKALGAFASTPEGQVLTRAAGAVSAFSDELHKATGFLKDLIEGEAALFGIRILGGRGAKTAAKAAGRTAAKVAGRKAVTTAAEEVGTEAAIGETAGAAAGLGPIGWGLGGVELGIMGLDALWGSPGPGKNWSTKASSHVPSATADQIGQAQDWVNKTSAGTNAYAKLRNQHPHWSDLQIFSVLGQRFPKVRKQFKNQQPGTEVTMDPLTGSYGVSPAGGATAAKASHTGGKATGTQRGGVSAGSVISTAERYLGSPYRWGGSSPQTGFDCSGLVQYAYARAGISLPRTAADQERVGNPVSPNDVQPGDLLFLGNPAHHVMMSIGNGQVIEAPHTGDVVKIIGFPASAASAIRRIIGSSNRGGPGGASGAHAGDPGDTDGVTDRLGTPVITGLGDIFSSSSGSALLAALAGSPTGGGGPGGATGASLNGSAAGSGSGVNVPAAPTSVTGNVALGRRLAANRGWSGKEWDALYWLWMHESGWRNTAENPTSGAYGIPQSLPASKMASAGADYRSNPATQIRWGMDYIANRYHDPLGAVAHERHYNWYERGAFDVLRDEIAQLHKGEMVLPAGTAAKVRQLVETPQSTQQQSGGSPVRRTVPVQLHFHGSDSEEAARRHANRFAKFVAEEHGIDMVASR